MKHWNVHPLAANFFDDKTIWRFNIFQIDRTECRLQRADDISQFFGVCFIQFDIKAIDIGKFFKQNRLAFHHRL